VLLGGELEVQTPALPGLAIGAYGLSQALAANSVRLALFLDRVGRKRMIYLG